MINKKLAGLLIIPAILSTINATYAISSNSSQVLECTLGTYLDITALTSGVVTATTITPDNGTLQKALISKFKINLNTDNQKLYLQAKTKGEQEEVNGLFQQGEQTYVMFANADKAPTTTAITDCKSAAPTAEKNANVIAYPIVKVDLDNGGKATFDNNKNQYNVEIKGGTTIATTTTGTTPYSNTYSFQDNAGTYKATMILTSASL